MVWCASIYLFLVHQIKVKFDNYFFRWTFWLQNFDWIQIDLLEIQIEALNLGKTNFDISLQINLTSHDWDLIMLLRGPQFLGQNGNQVVVTMFHDHEIMGSIPASINFLWRKPVTRISLGSADSEKDTNGGNLVVGINRL